MRDLKYIFKRVIIGILIGLFFLMFKTRVSFASTIDNATGTAYMQTMNCSLDSSNLSCSVGSPFKYIWTPNNANNTDDFNIFINNNNQYFVLIKNLIINYDFSNPITISSNQRTIGLQMGNGSWLSANRNSGELDIDMNFLPVDYINSNNSTDTRYVPHANYNFKPYYATWTDDNNVVHKCGIILNVNAVENFFTMNFDIPIGSVVSSITLYLGDYRLTDTYTIRQLTSTSGVYVLNSSYWIKNDSANYSSSFSQFNVHYNTYRTKPNTYDNATDSNRGLYLYQLGKTTYSNYFKVPKNNNELTIVSNDYSGNSYKWYFNDYDNTISNYIENTIPSIEEELTPPSDDDDLTPPDEPNNIDDNLEDWSSTFETQYARTFKTLFSSLFTYPLNKLDEMKDIDLVRTNINGDKVLNPLLCTRNSGLDSMIGDYNPYTIELGFGYSFNLPCPHYDIYPKLKARGYAFYPNIFKGASLGNGAQHGDFATLWLTLQHGILIYLMFVQVLNIYKYVLDANKTDIEVLEL